jgi:hypothetical protein
MMRCLTLSLALCGILIAQPVRAQATPEPLGRFVATVAYLWSQGDAEGLADLLPRDGQVLLDVGGGSEAVNARHAAAALRSLFSDHQDASARPVRTNLSGGQPVRGFGEIAWTFRTRRVPIPRSRTVYVGAVWTGDAWHLSEIRLMP